MTAPSYTNDLTLVDEAESTSNWDESSDSNWDDGGAATADSDYPYIQNSTAITQQATKASISSLLCDSGTSITLPTDGAYLVWQFFASSTGLDSYANGGMRVMVGSGLGAFYSWDVGGVDFGRNPYGGWMNHAVNTTGTADDTVGSPSGTEQFIGAAVKTLVAIGKGNPHGVDVIRYGRCSSIFEYGDAGNGYCTFAGYAAQNDGTNNRWGLIQAQPGGYLYKGKMTLGTTSNAVDFRDEGTNVFVDNTPKVTSSFNTIEVNNASSRVDWTNIVITSLGTKSPGRLVCNANADLNWDGCIFSDMATFVLGGTGSELLNCIWNRCKTITVAGGKLNGSSVLESSVDADDSAINWNVATDPDGYLDNLTVSKGTNAHHAIEFGTSAPTSVTIRGMTATDFNASHSQNDSTFYVARTGGSVTINCVGCTGNMTYKSAGATVTIVQDPITITITVKDANTQGVIQGARVLLLASAGTGDLPYQDSVTTITRSGSTATVTHSSHGLVTDDIAYIQGANEDEYNGAWVITKIDDNSYSYTILGTPSSPATGTIISTGGIFNELTNASGIVTDTRSISNDQPFTANIRKSSSSPYYKPVSISDTIDNTNGFTATVQMISDD